MTWFQRRRLRFWCWVAAFVDRRLHLALIKGQLPQNRRKSDLAKMRIRHPFQ